MFLFQAQRWKGMQGDMTFGGPNESITKTETGYNIKMKKEDLNVNIESRTITTTNLKTKEQNTTKYNTLDDLFRSLEKDFGVSRQAIDWLRQQSKRDVATESIDAPTAYEQNNRLTEKQNKDLDEEKQKAKDIVSERGRNDFFTG